MIIWLASYPRSGNRFTREVLGQCFGIPTWSIYPGGETAITSSEIEAFQGRAELRVVKTHANPSDRSPALYVYRDGRDSLVSYSRFLQQREPAVAEMTWEAALESVIRGELGFGNWSEHIAAWQVHSFSNPVAWISYEELLSDAAGTVKRALEKLSVPHQLLTTVPPDFHELQAKSPKLFRKGKAGSWREEMPARLVELFEELHAPTMRNLGYPLENAPIHFSLQSHAPARAA